MATDMFVHIISTDVHIVWFTDVGIPDRLQVFNMCVLICPLRVSPCCARIQNLERSNEELDVK